MPSPTPTPTVNPLKKFTAQSKLAFLFSVVALISASVAITYATMAWKQWNDIHRDIKQQTQALAQNMSQKQQDTAASIHILKQQTEQLQQHLTATQSSLAHVVQATTKTSAQRALGDTTYLIHLANLHLTLGHDASTALKLLQMAEQRLTTINNPAVFALKHALTHDIAALKSAPTVNISKLVLRLDQVSQAVQTLPGISAKRFKMSPKVTPDAEPSLQKTWYQKLAVRLSGLKDLIVVRRIKTPVTPLLTPEQDLFLRENIQLKISQAEWAVLHQDPLLYQQSLSLAIQWLTQYYPDQMAAANVLSTLKSLKTINIKPPLPSISDSLNALSHHTKAQP